MAKNFNLYVLLGLNPDQFNRGLNQARTSLQGFASNVSANTRGMFSGMEQGFRNISGLDFKGLGIIGAIALIGSQFKAAIQDSIKFEKSLASLKALTGASASDMSFYRQQAMELGNQFGKTGAEMAETFKIIGSGKSDLLKNKEGLVEVSAAAVTLSKTAGLDVPQAADALVVVMNQFGAGADQASRYINAMAAAAKEGAAEVPDLADSLTKFGAVAKLMNLSIEQSVSLIEALSEKGIKGEIAGTGLKSFLLKLGAGADDTNPKVVGLGKALDNLAAKHMSISALTDKFGLETANVAAALIEQHTRVNELTTAVTGTNEAYKQASINSDTVSANVEKLSATWSNFRVNLVNGSGALTQMLKGLLLLITETLNGLTHISMSKTERMAQRKATNESEVEGIASGAYSKNAAALEKINTDKYAKTIKSKKDYLAEEKRLAEEIDKLQQKKDNGWLTGDGEKMSNAYDTKAAKAQLETLKSIATQKKLIGEQAASSTPNKKVQTATEDYQKEVKANDALYRAKLIKEDEYQEKKMSNARAYLETLAKEGQTASAAYQKTLAEYNKAKGAIKTREIISSDAEGSSKNIKLSVDLDQISLKDSFKKQEDEFSLWVEDEIKAFSLNKKLHEIEIPISIQLAVKDLEFAKDLNKELTSRMLSKKDEKVRLTADYIQSPENYYGDLFSGLDNGVSSIASISNAFGNLSEKIKSGKANVGDYFNAFSTGAKSIIEIVSVFKTLSAVLDAGQAADNSRTQMALSNDSAKVAGNTAVAASEAGASVAGIPFVGIALAAGAIAAILGLFSQLKFANGGIVPGNSFIGDRIPALVNSGEMILNKGQQSRLFRMLNNGSSAGSLTGEIRGRGRELSVIVKNDNIFRSKYQ